MVQLEELGTFKKCNDVIGNRTRNLVALLVVALLQAGRLRVRFLANEVGLVHKAVNLSTICEPIV
jgi:hypothetical protein